MATYPHARAAVIRVDSITPPEGTTIEHRGQALPASEIVVYMYQGMASMGYQTDYQRVPTYWVEAICYGPVGREKIVKRQCWRFSGKTGEDRADHAYRSVLRNLAMAYPNADATFPTAWALSAVA